MYNVSNDYKTALLKPAKVRRLTGYVGSIAFTEENIIRGSFVIENKCSDGSDITFGYAYMSSLSCVFRGINLTGEWKNKVITVSEGLLIDPENDTWEYVPLGVYTIEQADHREDGVYVVAYDNFKLLDKDFIADFTTGTPYDFLSVISQKCGITLAQTEEQVRALPNGTQAFALYGENGIESYREFLYWVAQVMGCFSVITRDGKLEVRRYGNGTGDSVDTIRTTDRWRGASFSDFTTNYTGISVTNMDDDTETYLGMPHDDGLTYKMGANPLLQNMSLELVLTNLLNELATIHYTPFMVDRSGAPHYDLGDVLDFPGGFSGGSVGCLMAFNYTFRGAYQMFGYGSNPAISKARNKTDKDMSNLMSRIRSDTIQYYTYMNSNEYEIREEYVDVINIRFGSVKSTLVTFQAEIKFDGEIEEEEVESIVSNIKYLINGVEADYHPVETWIEGKHLLHLLYLIPIQDAAINTFKVRMNCEGGVINISRADLNAVISGQGLVSTSAWDGYIEVEDNIPEISFSRGLGVVKYTDEIEISIITPIVIEMEDNIPEIAFSKGPETIKKYKDTVYMNKEPLNNLTWADVFMKGTWQNILDDYGW